VKCSTAILRGLIADRLPARVLRTVRPGPGPRRQTADRDAGAALSDCCGRSLIPPGRIRAHRDLPTCWLGEPSWAMGANTVNPEAPAPMSPGTTWPAVPHQATARRPPPSPTTPGPPDGRGRCGPGPLPWRQRDDHPCPFAVLTIRYLPAAAPPLGDVRIQRGEGPTPPADRALRRPGPGERPRSRDLAPRRGHRSSSAHTQSMHSHVLLIRRDHDPGIRPILPRVGVWPTPKGLPVPSPPRAGGFIGGLVLAAARSGGGLLYFAGWLPPRPVRSPVSGR
jgi:hypothetical protein